jgi:hypothetical protein
LKFASVTPCSTKFLSKRKAAWWLLSTNFIFTIFRCEVHWTTHITVVSLSSCFSRDCLKLFY